MNDSLFTIRAAVSNIELDSSLETVTTRMTRENMARRLAAEIVDKHLKAERCEYHTMFSLTLYVLTPDELHRLVRNEATRLVQFMR